MIWARVLKNVEHEGYGVDITGMHSHKALNNTVATKNSLLEHWKKIKETISQKEIERVTISKSHNCFYHDTNHR